MRIGPSGNVHRRRGVIIPLTALLMVAILGMVAFAVDIGWITVTQSELQNAADAAALAGAAPLIDGYVLYTLPNQNLNQKKTILTNALTNARSKAKEFAGYNGAGGVTSLNLNDSDVEFGIMDNNNNYTPYNSNSTIGEIVQGIFNGTPFPNTIKVTLRRDSQANGSLTLFFGSVLGTAQTNLTATASATLYGGALNTIPTGYALPMPITYDVNNWNTFLQTGLDAYGNLQTDASGNPVLKVYSTFVDKGNFGLLSLDGTHTGATITNDWILNGPNADDIKQLTNRNLIPLSNHDATKWNWIGNPGFEAGNVSALNGLVGQTFIMPLFTPKNSLPYKAGDGQGSNYYYNIVQMVAIRIMPTSDTNRDIVVQPAKLVVPDTLLTNVQPVGSTSNWVTLTTPKLTR